MESTTYDFTTGVERAFINVMDFVPKFLGFLLILVIGYFVARFLGKMLDAVLEKVGFDRIVERGGIKQALSRSGYDVSTLLGKLVFYTLMLFVLQLAFAVFGPNPISTLINDAIAYIPNILVAAVIIVVTAAIASGVKDIVGGALGGMSYGPTLATTAMVAIWVMGGFMALDQLNIAPAIVTGTFYAMLAIVVGVAVVAIGGGGIKPMEERWRSMMAKADAEAPKVKEEIAAAALDAERKKGYVL